LVCMILLLYICLGRFYFKSYVYICTLFCLPNAWNTTVCTVLYICSALDHRHLRFLSHHMVAVTNNQVTPYSSGTSPQVSLRCCIKQKQVCLR
jgi:hypothetical protein